MTDTASTTWRNYAVKGDGIHFVQSPPSAAEMKRINMLVDMNNQVKKYRGRRSKKGLLEMAAEYETKKMPRMAEGLRTEAANLTRVRVRMKSTNR